MIDYLEWLTAGLVFLWILSAHDARAAPVGPGNACGESSSQCGSPRAPPAPVPAAPIGFVRQIPARSSPAAPGDIAAVAAEPGTRSRILETETC